MMSWKEQLEGKIEPELQREIEIFALQIELRGQDKVEEKLFAETRLRKGVYGQRYDNGVRHDGNDVQSLGYEEKLSKGPNTVWDAPGMQRIKLPYGGLNAEQLEVLAELAEEYSDQIVHVTTRQDVQLHFVHLEDTPDIMRRLGSVGITTQEACGNSVRNVTACPLAGVCRSEVFDVTPYASAVARFLLGHPDAQAFGRKFKISLSGCADHACGLANMHDIGLIAKTKDGRRGFQMYVGGGLGAVPRQAKLFRDFLPAEELLPMSQAICRVFAKHGEKRLRGRARMKFLIEQLGLERFDELVLEERAKLRDDPRWRTLLEGAEQVQEVVLSAPETKLVALGKPDGPPEQWRDTNVYAQKQQGFSTITVCLPLGDLTSDQLRGLAQTARQFGIEQIRTTVEQNIVLRHVPNAKLDGLFAALDRIGLAQPGAGTIVDITSCPGTDTCKLGIASSRGLAAELRGQLAQKNVSLDQAVKDLRIKISGCFNSCGQHHVADIGFYGVTRKRGRHQVPFFQVVLGGKWRENAGALGLAIGAVPSRRIPETLERIIDRYVEGRESNETFQQFVERTGRANIRAWLDDLSVVPPYETSPELFSDWGDPREYSMSDHGVGECAGAVVPAAEFGLQASEREVFEAQVLLDEATPSEAAKRAYEAMLTAAKSLVEMEVEDIAEEPEAIADAFKTRFFDTKRFFDPFAKGKFAQYFFNAHQHRDVLTSAEGARQRVEEAQLFIEAAHACYDRISQGGAS